MDSIMLSQSLDFISSAGVCLAAERLELLKSSLVILQKENHFRKIYYWGRINGHENDYHIAFGYIKDCLKGQLYYYRLNRHATESMIMMICDKHIKLKLFIQLYDTVISVSSNCLDWLLLPKVTRTERILTPLVSNLFHGNPSISTSIDIPDDLLNNLNIDNEVENIQVNPIPKRLKEEDRLAATIDMINENAMIIPRGSWLKHPNGDITVNLAFSGLNFNESIQMKSYLHARLPQKKWNENLLTRHDYNYSMDFLDPIDGDAPKECWNLQLQLKNNSIILQNLYWPGMTFYQIINSPHYGSIYVGNGKQNLDVPFMV